MFANLLHLLTGRPAATDYQQAFVKDVHVPQRRARNPRTEKIIIVAWVLIALKAIALEWAVHTYAVPINALWVILPTVAMGLLATVLYLRRL